MMISRIVRLLSIKFLGMTVSLGLMTVAVGGALTSGFVLETLSEFKTSWHEMVAAGHIPNAEELTGTVSFMSFLVTWGSVATISTLLCVGLFFFWFTLRKVVGPMEALTGVMDRLAVGDLSVDIPYIGTKDEVGRMANAVAVMKKNTEDKLEMESHQRERDEEAAQERRAEMKGLADSFEERVASLIMVLTESAREMQKTAQEMAQASEQTVLISGNVSSRATEADTNVHEVSAATERLSACAHEISQQINTVIGMADDASREAETTSQEVNQLLDMAQSIGDVVDAIKDTAEQTNLLALNATIEAARAGEAGKGFAVVADEVKKLANETADRTTQISERVSHIQRAIHGSADAMNNIIESVKRIDNAAGAMSASVAEQNDVTAEIGRSVHEASAGTQHVSSSILSVQEKAQSSGESSKTVLSAANELLQMSEDLQQQVSEFLQGIRDDRGNKQAAA